MSIHIDADSLTPKQLRAALAASSRVYRAGLTNKSIPATDGNGRPFVGCSGPDYFSMKTVGLSPEGALAVLVAIVGTDTTRQVLDAIDQMAAATTGNEVDNAIASLAATGEQA